MEKSQQQFMQKGSLPRDYAGFYGNNNNNNNTQGERNHNLNAPTEIEKCLPPTTGGSLAEKDQINVESDEEIDLTTNGIDYSQK